MACPCAPRPTARWLGPSEDILSLKHLACEAPFRGQIAASGSMIPKSGHRFSEKIMLNKTVPGGVYAVGRLRAGAIPGALGS
jgi:hypothetical protein